MSAREQVLARVREALGPQRGAVEVPRDYRHAAPASLDVLVDRLKAYRAVVHRVGAQDVASTLGTLLACPVLVPRGFPEEWLDALDVLRDIGQSPQHLDQVASVLTTCAVAIAETGTVVLDAGPGQGRRALTLVPDHHVVVVRAEQVVGSVPQALAWLDARRPQTWISGPSATSDIELQRVEGVHGPRRLEVVLVAET